MPRSPESWDARCGPLPSAALCFLPENYQLRVMAHTCNLAARESEAGGV